jgi:hypothetical protein
MTRTAGRAVLWLVAIPLGAAAVTWGIGWILLAADVAAGYFTFGVIAGGVTLAAFAVWGVSTLATRAGRDFAAAAGWGSTAGFLAVVYASLPAFLSVLSLR